MPLSKIHTVIQWIHTKYKISMPIFNILCILAVKMKFSDLIYSSVVKGKKMTISGNKW